MLFFYTVPETVDLEDIQRSGLGNGDLQSDRLFRDVRSALQRSSGPVLIIDTSKTESGRPNTDEFPRVTAVAPGSIRNLGPYRPPVPVVAAGGYVCCGLPDDVALLVIFRRGVWDLPKGKTDSGEDVEQCAKREVREEVGIERLTLLDSLGATQHAYPDGAKYAVKTTHWFLMTTPERTFQPDRREGIRRVQWARWAVARRHIGYDNLRRHMDEVETDIRASFR